jgi:hypothetical protein
MSRLPALAVCLGLLLVAGLAAAQPAAGAPLQSDVRFAGELGFRLRTSSDDKAETAVVLTRVSSKLAPIGAPIELHKGTRLRTALGVRPDAVLVALVRSGAHPSVRFALLRLGPDGSPGAAPLVLDATARRTGNDSAPTAVVICPDPEGFTVLWQEQSTRDPNGEARAYLGRIGVDGRWIAPAAAVPIPWAIGAIARTGDHYHLAVYYDGARPDQTRLCFVTLSAAGQPEQHPWWATPPEMVDEVQLQPVGSEVVAYYRGGAHGAALRSVRVTTPGQWGTEPPAPADHGTIAAGEDYALRLAGSGEVEVLR